MYIFPQVTTHSHLLSSDEVDDLKILLEEMGSFFDVNSFLLQEFDTELDFTSKVGLVDTVITRGMGWGQHLHAQDKLCLFIS